MSLTTNQQFYEIIKNSEKPLVIFRNEHNADTIGSSLAFQSFLQKLGKNTDIVSREFNATNNYKFLPKIGTIQDQLINHRKLTLNVNLGQEHEPEIKHEQQKDKLNIFITPKSGNFVKENIVSTKFDFKHDLIITLNTPDLENLGSVFHNNTDFFYKVPIINIDHVPENEHYGQLNIIDLKASSIAEIIYHLIAGLELVDEQIATYLLSGMIEKTKSFKIPNITPQSLNIAGKLIAAGAQRDLIIQNLFQTKTVDTLRLWGRILQKLQTDKEQKIAWAEISENEFNSAHELTGVIDELIVNIPSIEFTAIFYTLNQKKYCLIKSEKNIDLLAEFFDFRPIRASKSLVEFEMHVPYETILQKLANLI